MVRLKVRTCARFESFERFQFLMVRLKGFLSARSASTSSISIPYGSIKRDESVAMENEASKFQFLMVRLKGKEIQERIDNEIFQFLMVRLKV